MLDEPEPNFPLGTPDETELFLRWLRYLRYAVIRKISGLSEAEFTPGPELTVDGAIAAYRARAAATDAAVWSIGSLSRATKLGDGTDLRWVLVHLINETARHAGHADATRQLLDGTTGE